MLARLGELLQIENLKGSYFNTCSQSTKLLARIFNFLTPNRIFFSPGLLLTILIQVGQTGHDLLQTRHQFTSTCVRIAWHLTLRCSEIGCITSYHFNGPFIKVQVPLQYHWNGKIQCIALPSGKLTYPTF